MPQANPNILILRYEDIEEELRHGRLITEHTQSSIQASSYDLRVGTVFRDGQIVNKNHQRAGEQIVIQPGEILSLLTMEELQLPDSMIAIAFPMNKWSSEGLLVLNPGYVDPGFKGPAERQNREPQKDAHQHFSWAGYLYSGLFSTRREHDASLRSQQGTRRQRN